MDVETPSAADSGPTATYAVVAGGAAAALAVAAVRLPPVAAALTVAWTALAAGAAARIVGDGLLALRSPSPPPPPAKWPSVSVVVVAYNEADVLGATLAACRALDYPSFEVVVCYESASTDGTAAVAEAAAREDDRVTAVRRDGSPAGKAAAVNDAVARASGDVIASIDANQRPDERFLRRAVRWFRDDDVRCVKGRCYGTNPGDSLVALHATVERHLLERAEFYAREVAGGLTLFTGGQVVFRADLLDDVGSFDESVLTEDIEMACRVHEAGFGVRVDPGVVTYERNPASLGALLAQRKRWARGVFQVARRHAVALLRSPWVSPVAKLDAAFTFGYALLAPLLALSLPAVLVAAPPPSQRPVAAALRLSPAVAVPVTAALVFGVDRVAGRSHAPREYLAALTLPIYAAVQSAVVVTAFLDEFLLDAPTTYVTSSTEEPSADD
ncbi:glycosyltransferase [Halostella litorea]|uniref:glycosyltransferase n=1 Tax=Halostella litorea TaxID=2528831 RepID=UPI00109211DE|nr:glycosyltransferase family 2 protein [Halostella litorea]